MKFRPTHLNEVRCLSPGEHGPFTLRVIGLPGDTVSVRAGYAFVDGAPVDKGWVTSGGGVPGRTVKVAAGTYYVLGDDRAHSCDSRVWGLLPATNVLSVRR